ncbi:hypothetical protein EGY22_11075 [Alcaligenes faecalis]|nr:hypothetical protein CPY64_05305 [Alcaligenes faecalis]AYZ91972.1 hypothetical protein EGY22_11075 [Alcaligenes faecalis]
MKKQELLNGEDIVEEHNLDLARFDRHFFLQTRVQEQHVLVSPYMRQTVTPAEIPRLFHMLPFGCKVNT